MAARLGEPHLVIGKLNLTPVATVGAIHYSDRIDLRRRYLTDLRRRPITGSCEHLPTPDESARVLISLLTPRRDAARSSRTLLRGSLRCIAVTRISSTVSLPQQTHLHLPHSDFTMPYSEHCRWRSRR